MPSSNVNGKFFHEALTCICKTLISYYVFQLPTQDKEVSPNSPHVDRLERVGELYSCWPEFLCLIIYLFIFSHNNVLPVKPEKHIDKENKNLFEKKTESFIKNVL